MSGAKASACGKWALRQSEGKSLQAEAPLEFLHFQGRSLIDVWGRLSTCGRLAIGVALDHGNSSGVAARPAVTGFLSM